MKVEIWSDFVCPFCYIGKQKFENALARFAHKASVATELRSFELNPHADSASGKTTSEMLAAKYGMGIEQVKAMTGNVTAQAAAVGLTFRLEGTLELNTFDAHRIAQWAASQENGKGVADKLFKAYFTDNGNISDHGHLAALAAEAGLDGAEALSVLQSDRYSEAVRADEETARRLGVTGVPFFVIDGKYAISGAQPEQLFLDTLNKAWSERQPSLVQVEGGDGDVCGEDGCLPGSR